MAIAIRKGRFSSIEIVFLLDNVDSAFLYDVLRSILVYEKISTDVLMPILTTLAYKMKVSWRIYGISYTKYYERIKVQGNYLVLLTNVLHFQ